MHYLIFACGLLLATVAHAQGDEVNVLNYYAVGNTLDGQPMVEMMNELRFYPVYAMREYIDTVNIQITVGSHEYPRPMRRHGIGEYWQCTLPPFKLGDAIQRIEVEIRSRFDKQTADINNRIKEEMVLREDGKRLQLNSGGNTARNTNINNWLSQLTILKHDSARIQNENILACSTYLEQENNAAVFMHEQGVNEQHIRALVVASRYGRVSADYLDPIVYTRSPIAQSVLDCVNILHGRYEQWRERYENNTRALNRIVADMKDVATIVSEHEMKGNETQIEVLLSLKKYRDSTRQDLMRQMQSMLTDPAYSGPSVQKSDIVIYDDLSRFRILYRNNKSALRYMPALDPVERMGIFRARYVPFPIYGKPGSGTCKDLRLALRGPSSDNPTVFEFGLTFGETIVPGDDFVMPEFSLRRFGVAIALTQQVFSSKADLIGLALTYDVNTYCSLGVGGNFAKGEVHPYASIGINKRAFENLLGELSSVFR